MFAIIVLAVAAFVALMPRSIPATRLPSGPSPSG